MYTYYLERAAQWMAPSLYYTQLHNLTKPWYAGFGHILMFHRVIPVQNKPRVRNHRSLEVSPELLENTILFFKRAGYHFATLDEAAAMAQDSKNLKKFVVFTFDDGYEDNLTHAYPVFRKHNVPFTVYITTGLPDGGCILWWYLLEDLILNSSNIEFEHDNNKFRFRTQTDIERETAFRGIRSLFIKADEVAMNLLVHALFKKENLYKKNHELSLNWDQVRQLSLDPLVTIGSHTINHYSLKALAYEQSYVEIAESKKKLEARIDSEVKHFCYPLGLFGSKEEEILEKCGYQSAVTIKMANIFKENYRYPYALPRIMINSLTNEKILRLQINGLLPALRNKFRRVVT